MKIGSNVMIGISGAFLLVLSAFPSKADIFQGQFDFTGTLTSSTNSEGPAEYSGTASFSYNPTTNQGTLSVIPDGNGNPSEEYTFGVFYKMDGDYYALPIQAPADLISYPSFLFDGAPLGATFLITPPPLLILTGSGTTTLTGGTITTTGSNFPPSGTYTFPAPFDLSAITWLPVSGTGDSLNAGNLTFEVPDFIDNGSGTLAIETLDLFQGTYSNFAVVPEPSTGWCLLLGSAFLFLYRRIDRNYLRAI